MTIDMSKIFKVNFRLNIFFQ